MNEPALDDDDREGREAICPACDMPLDPRDKCETKGCDSEGGAIDREGPSLW